MKYVILLIASTSILMMPSCSNKTLNIALEMYKAKEIDSAKIYIDKTMQEKKVKPEYHYYKGFIYKKIYQSYRDSDYEKANEAREVALESFLTFLHSKSRKHKKLDSTAVKSLNYLSSTIFNEIPNAINLLDCELAEERYNTFKTVCLENNSSCSSYDVQIYNILGQTYYRRWENDSIKYPNSKKQGIRCYKNVLNVDSMNLSANYNMGIIFFNESVTKLTAYFEWDKYMNELSMNGELPSLETIMQCPVKMITEPKDDPQLIQLFRTSLPYFLKAYEVAPEKKKSYS